MADRKVDWKVVLLVCYLAVWWATRTAVYSADRTAELMAVMKAALTAG